MDILKKLSPSAAFITGGAGFIGSNLVKILLGNGWKVTVYDNLTLGKVEFIEEFLNNPSFTFLEKNLLDLDHVVKGMSGHNIVFHMAANSDISYGAKHTDVDMKLGTIVTYNVLEAMRINNIKKIIFASTSAIYGEAETNPTPENYGPLLPISLYGASKLACEGLISAFCHNFSFQSWIFRFGNIVGKNGTHGAIYDFIKKMKKDPARLEVLGDGKQSKPYLHVLECIEGILYGYLHSGDEVNIFNLACDGGSNVAFIAKTVTEEMGFPSAELAFTGGSRGWVGDVPFVRLDPTKMKTLGWKTKNTSDQSIRKSVQELLQQL